MSLQIERWVRGCVHVCVCVYLHISTLGFELFELLNMLLNMSNSTTITYSHWTLHILEIYLMLDIA